jgi:acetylornithine deacetylase
MTPGLIPEDALRLGRQEVVPLVQRMVAFDTDAGSHDDPPRADALHQEFVAEYLSDLGAEVELFEPEASLFAAHPMVLPGQTFAGRPVLWARFAGHPEGRSLLFNGHYDTVLADPLELWTHDARSGAVVDGRLYARGSCDMKGGNAAAVAAIAGLVKAGVQLPGDVLINLVPFEEVNGMGTTATMLSGRRADGAVCCEPTELRPLIACRGTLALGLNVHGRAAHAEIAQPHHSQGGGVNAIDKLVDLLSALRSLNEAWRTRPDKQHRLLSTPVMLPSMLDGGNFWASWPEHARATFDVTYLPQDADSDGYGGRVREEIERFVATRAELDDWLVDHQPQLRWVVDYPPIEIDATEPIVELACQAVQAHTGGPVSPGGFDSWADQVNLVREGSIPTVLLGPGSILQAHTTDEYVEVAQLEAAVAVYAELAMRWGAPP